MVQSELSIAVPGTNLGLRVARRGRNRQPATAEAGQGDLFVAKEQQAGR